MKVNELMDTMMAEKQALKEKIASLEVRVPHNQYMAHGYFVPLVPFTNTSATAARGGDVQNHAQ